MRPIYNASLGLSLGVSLALAGCTGDAEAGGASDEAPQSIASEVGDFRDITVDEVNALLSSEGGAVVLDVRTPQEFETGHIDGAVNVDFTSDDFAMVLAELDRDTTYILHCKSGSRSMRALDVMQEQGFTSVAHLTAGYDGWKAAQDTGEDSAE